MLELQHISWTAPGGSQVLRDVSLTIPEGKLTVITGPNGGGKTTLAKIIAGIETPDSGKIFLDGKDITGLDVTQRAREGVSFAFQQPVRFKGFTVRKLLELSAGKTLTSSAVCELLGRVGLCGREYLDREVDATLSGGEKKRVEIATVLAKDHKVSVFDEPEAGIDLWSFSMLVKQFERIHRSKEESLVLISHQERIIRMADRIMVVRDGKVEEIGSRDEILPKLFLEETSCACMDRAEGR